MASNNFSKVQIHLTENYITVSYQHSASCLGIMPHTASQFK